MRCTTFHRRLLIAIATMMITSTTASAGWNEFWHKLGVGYHRNNAWPDPFNEADAVAVVMPFEIMKNNGWVLHNTLGAEQFRPGDGALLTSGQTNVAWIARQAPVSRRQVFVVRGSNQQETEARLVSVRDALRQYHVAGPAPEVFVTDRVPPTAPGSWATKVNRAWLEELASPKLPNSSAAGTTGITTQ